MTRLRFRSATVASIVLLAPLCAVVGHEMVMAQRLRAQVAELEQSLAAASTARPVFMEESAAPEPAGVCQMPWPEPAGEVEVEVEAAPAPSCEAQAEAGALSQPGAFAFVGDGRLILDSHVGVAGGYGKTHGDAVGRKGPAWAERGANLWQHEGYEEIEGAEFRLFDAHGEVCRVEIGDAFYRAEVSGDFGLEWEGDDFEAFNEYSARVWEEEAELPQDRYIELIARERILGLGETRLEVDFEVVDGDCEGAVWARAAKLSAPTFWRSDADAETLEAVREELRGHENYRWSRERFEELRRDYPEEVSESTWVAHEAETLEIERWRHPSGRSLDFVALGVAGECGEGDTRSEMIGTGGKFEDGPGTAMTVFSVGDEDFFVHANRDEEPYLYQRSDEGQEIVTEFVIPFYGCPC